MDLYSAVAAHVFASVIHRPHRSAFGRCPSGLWLLRAIARSKLPALATSRLHIRTVSTADPDHSRPRVLTASHVLLLKRDAPSARALAHQHHEAGAERRYLIHICVDDKGLYRARTSGRLIVVEFLICQIVSLLSSPPSPSPSPRPPVQHVLMSRSSTSPTDEDEE